MAGTDTQSSQCCAFSEESDSTWKESCSYHGHEISKFQFNTNSEVLHIAHTASNPRQLCLSHTSILTAQNYVFIFHLQPLSSRFFLQVFTRATASSPLSGCCCGTQIWISWGKTVRNCSRNSNSRICSFVHFSSLSH